MRGTSEQCKHVQPSKQTNQQPSPTTHPSAKQPVSHQPIKPTALLLQTKVTAPTTCRNEKKPEANVVHENVLPLGQIGHRSLHVPHQKRRNQYTKSDKQHEQQKKVHRPTARATTQKNVARVGPGPDHQKNHETKQRDR
jgi:hypothetical protein